MKRRTRRTARLGELIAAVFDEAARTSADPREVSRLATRAIQHLTRGARGISAALFPTAADPDREPPVDGLALLGIRAQLVPVRSRSC